MAEEHCDHAAIKTAVISEQDYRAAQTQMLLNKFYEGSARGLVSTLIEREMLSAEDYEELNRFWEEEKKNR